MGKKKLTLFSRRDRTTYFFKVWRCALMTCLFSSSGSRWQLSYVSIHLLQVLEAVLGNDVSMGIGQGCSARFTRRHSVPDTAARHHVFLTNISRMSKFYSEKSLYKINKCLGKNLSFVNNACMRCCAAQNGKENHSNKAEMLDLGRSMWSHITY